MDSRISPTRVLGRRQGGELVGGSSGSITPRGRLAARVLRTDASVEAIEITAAIEMSLEVEVLKAGGLLPTILRRASVDR